MSARTNSFNFASAASRRTPGITRRAFNLVTDKFTMTSELTRGRVHAVVRLRVRLLNIKALH